MSNVISYARISTTSQNLDAQIDALKRTGCAKTFTDKESGIKSSHFGWDELLAYIRPGDTLVITELSRMSRSLLHLLEIVTILEDRHVELKSLRENIDTSTATGRGFLSTMGVIAQMEREIKAEPNAPLPEERLLKPEERPAAGLAPIQINWNRPEFSIKIQINRQPKSVNSSVLAAEPSLITSQNKNSAPHKPYPRAATLPVRPDRNVP